jgi:hypothetical protein
VLCCETLMAPSLPRLLDGCPMHLQRWWQKQKHVAMACAWLNMGEFRNVIMETDSLHLVTLSCLLKY